MRPKLQAFSSHLTRVFGSEGDERGEWGGVFEAVADGQTMKSIAEGLGAYLVEGEIRSVSRGMLYLWIDAGGAERKEAYKRSRLISAHSMADEATAILDGTDQVGITSSEVTSAVARANHRKWLASRYNREVYGETPAALINFNMGDLHLQALQAKGLPPSREQKEAAIEESVEADYEVIEENEAVAALLEADE